MPDGAAGRHGHAERPGLHHRAGRPRVRLRDTRSQTQILAGSSESTVSATATATWAKTGAIPALSAEKNCAEGGVDITAANKGDAPFTFELMGLKHTIAAGESRTVTIPVAEDQAYDFTITGPGGFRRTSRACWTARPAATPSTAGSARVAAEPGVGRRRVRLGATWPRPAAPTPPR